MLGSLDDAVSRERLKNIKPGETGLPYAVSQFPTDFHVLSRGIYSTA
jgi:hypothetical protein